MEIVEVTAHFDRNGKITPLSFVWEKNSFRIIGTGRRWQAKDEIHMLVMVEGSHTFHLVFNCDKSVWKLVKDSNQTSLTPS